MAILGLNLVIGYSGQLSLGHSAFVGLGAYTTIILVSDHHWSFFATIPVSAAACFLLGCIVGLPALRIRGLYLAIVTLSLAFVFPTLVLKYGSLTGGPNGKKPERGQAKMDPPSWIPFNNAGRLASPLWIYTILMVMAVILFVLARNFVKSRPGRALIAVRDNQTSAAISGVNLPIYKVLAFGVSAAFGGIAGTMLMMNKPFASDTQFTIQLAIFLVVGLVIGGAGTISGAVPGALVYVFIPYFMSGVDERPVRDAGGDQADHQTAVRLAEHQAGQGCDRRRVLRRAAAHHRVHPAGRDHRRAAPAARPDHRRDAEPGLAARSQPHPRAQADRSPRGSGGEQRRSAG